MKKILLFFIIGILSCSIAIGQNVGIGTAEPVNKLQVNGSLLITTPATGTDTAPTGAQTKTMLNSSTIFYSASDSTGRMYDPGGPAGNYAANMTAYADISTSTNTGLELTIESIQLGTGDSLFIREFSGGPNLLAVGNNYSSAGKWIFNSPIGILYIIFKSNGDASTGSGFSLLVRGLYDNSQSQTDLAGFMGKALSFDTKSGAFRAGMISNGQKGYGSTALGGYTSATGEYSTALGIYTTANGYGSSALGLSSTADGIYSIAIGNSSQAQSTNSMAFGNRAIASDNYATAIGYYSTASGIKSTALGDSTTASGNYATAFGNHTLASGDFSTASGLNTTASGLRSTAMGNNASTNGHANSLAIGGTGAATVCTSPNQFMTRFDNYTFWISGSNYAYLLPSSNGWAYTSDRFKKERFEEMNGETVLKKISKIPFYSWSFNSPDTRQYRHYGIMAQDFYGAFGHDSYGSIGNDSTVSTLDLLGVAYSAIKELEKRTSLLQEQQEKKTDENNKLKEDNLLLLQRLGMLEKKMDELLKKEE